MSGEIKYEFTNEVWQYSTPQGWHFVSIPLFMAKEIRQILKCEEQGWGRLRAKAKIGNIAWNTAIWFDTKMNTYILPIKASIRKNAKIEKGDNVFVEIWI